MNTDIVSKLLTALECTGLNHQIEADIKPIGDRSYTGQRVQIRMAGELVSVIDTRERTTLASCQSNDDLKVSQLVLQAISTDNGGQLWI